MEFDLFADLLEPKSGAGSVYKSGLLELAMGVQNRLQLSKSVCANCTCQALNVQQRVQVAGGDACVCVRRPSPDRGKNFGGIAASSGVVVQEVSAYRARVGEA